MSTPVFAVGQRWVSNTETDLGLGIVAQLAHRRVEVTFPAAGEQRVYAADNAPLGRVIYPVGERVHSDDGDAFTITETHQENGCVVYTGVDEAGQPVTLHEVDLDSFVHFSKPQDRLFAGQVDSSKRFLLRCETLRHRHLLAASPVQGLLGPRVQLLPHQLYIASQVAQRHAPRVLLADEVGLGKTIEAGLVLHQQLTCGQASRVLIVLPESLVHQWLVEMLRRFNLRFTVLDEQRCLAIESPESDADLLSADEAPATEDQHPVTGGEIPDNPFETAQLVICSLDWIVSNPERGAQALAAQWDLLVVDEAHHLAWHEASVSPEYALVEALARKARGALLLTATPEQLGVEGHFARLRLLDPDRYHDLRAFLAEERQYQAVSDLLQRLFEESPGTEVSSQQDLVRQISTYVGAAEGEALAAAFDQEGAERRETVDRLATLLLDRHGTGRVLFRNTRAAVSGFPRRILCPHELPVSQEDAMPDGFDALDSFQGDSGRLSRAPRVQWLVTWLGEHRAEKVLVICAQAPLAKALEEHLRLREGLRSAVFHEGMTLLERDRAAAYFADDTDSAQVLVCSEIGSEGRNFQFARHLVLFDLPLNPDLLEQRIGRLDRIGQSRDIHIHVPYVDASAQHVLLRWYHQGLGAIEQVCPAGSTVRDQVGEALEHCLANPEDSAALEELITETAQRTANALQALQQGRDRLLEMNSCRPQVAEDVIEQVMTLEQGRQLESYLDRALDELGVEQHHHSADAVIIEPGDHMHGHSLDGLPEDGLTATYSRARALGREDMAFMTWEHPLVAGVMASIVDSDFGSTAIATIKLPPLKPGTLLLEAIFTLRYVAPRALGVARFITDSVTRVVVDEHGRQLADTLDEETLAGLCRPVKKNVASEMTRHIRPAVSALVERAETAVAEREQSLISVAREKAARLLGEELGRMESLAAVNPNIRGEEISYLRESLAAVDAALAAAALQMDALRVIVVAP